MNKVKYLAKGMAILSIFFLSGCAFGTRRPLLIYTPVSVHQPKNNIEVKVNSFEDKRTITDTVGYSRNGYGMRCAKVVPENSVTDWVTNALKAELTNAGYAVSDNENTANVIEGKAFDIFCDTFVTYEGRISLKLILKKNGTVVLEKDYSATKSGGLNWAATPASFAKTLEMTLQEVLKQALPDINKELSQK